MDAKPSEPSRLLSPNEVSALTGLSYKQLEAMRRRGEGPKHFKLCNRVKYPLVALEAWVRENGGEL
ncbi:MAG: helix-turn-helix domain-containing protein [Hyphomicrobiaceae bacterium]